MTTFQLEFDYIHGEREESPGHLVNHHKAFRICKQIFKRTSGDTFYNLPTIIGAWNCVWQIQADIAGTKSHSPKLMWLSLLTLANIASSRPGLKRQDN